MGSGKSAIGRALNRLTGLDVIDLDLYIERRFHKSISQLFTERGESGFRALETAMLDEVSKFEDVVVACGGGTPCFGRNMELMNSRGITVWLNTPVDTIHRRLCRARAKRPLIAHLTDCELLQYISTSVASRLPYYRQAQVELTPSPLENAAGTDETTRRLIQLINLQP